MNPRPAFAGGAAASSLCGDQSLSCPCSYAPDDANSPAGCWVSTCTPSTGGAAAGPGVCRGHRCCCRWCFCCCASVVLLCCCVLCCVCCLWVRHDGADPHPLTTACHHYPQLQPVVCPHNLFRPCSKLFHVAQHIELPKLPQLGPGAAALPPDQQLPPLLIINLQLPTYGVSGGSYSDIP